MSQPPPPPEPLEPVAPFQAEPDVFSSGLKKRYVFLAGAAYGLAMRLAFGIGLSLFAFASQPSNASGPMLWSFLVLVPLLIGGLTVYFSGGRERSLVYSLFSPWLPITAFVAGSAILLIEGSICIAMAMPLFLIMATLGGFSMWLVLKVMRPSPTVMHSLLLLPLLAGAWEQNQPLPNDISTSDASIHIAAKPEAIWQLINHATDIQTAEMSEGLAYRIGVPYPQEAITVTTDQGRVRKLRWQKGVHFDEPIDAWEQNRYIRWRYSFLADSIPPGALDEHVVIGGKYFDLVDTSYRLTPEAGGTRLDIHVTYRVSTNFNWYAEFWGRVLVDDAAKTILAFYKHRAENLEQTDRAG